ncbi:MAG: Slp family lipoprotein [Deltaproteobacteria bacterium]|nr:Slp family lipoprotein [Deltaproteobacteria bacterium]
MAGMAYPAYKRLKRYAIIGLFISMTAFAGCAPVISQKTLDTVDRAAVFKDVQAEPARYADRPVLFGGAIIAVENLTGATYVEVMQQPLNSRLKPVDPGNTQGRFIAVFKGFKDPAIYAPGRLLTVAGKVFGSQTRPLGKMDYRYPLIEVSEDHLWPGPGESASPGVSIGLGVGVYR